ncbi:uncharacterized mitochondrial protein AtMg00810-like [Capsicum annuum]|uniref:uncharacterized mitochondrial protein AtMg00810-like n=1 Tax=Capsicum annuum TaxID=4072 RepID=UPI001FB11A3C|nr:uncharacterized mitochondrial protein AtMg00810-like [Capsicum annuum]
MGAFEMFDLGILHYFLGLEVRQGLDGIFILQRKYSTELLQNFNMLNYNPSPTPMNMNEKKVFDYGTGATNVSYFRSLVGGVNYLSHTRSDIAFYVSLIPRFMHCPLKQHLGAAKRILRSTSRNVFSLGFGKISWSSRKEDTIALSSGKAEYMATTSTGFQAIWLRKLLVDLQKEQIGPTSDYYENKSCISQ